MIYRNGNILQHDGSYLVHISMGIDRDYRKPLHLESNFSSLNPFKMGLFSDPYSQIWFRKAVLHVQVKLIH